jgi:hypothetical protein
LDETLKTKESSAGLSWNFCICGLRKQQVYKNAITKINSEKNPKRIASPAIVQILNNEKTDKNDHQSSCLPHKHPLSARKALQSLVSIRENLAVIISNGVYVMMDFNSSEI